MKHAHALLLLVLTAVLWSFGGLLIKWVDWHPMAIAGMRSLIAGLVILVYHRRPRFDWSFPQIGGAICYAGVVILFVVANKLTTAANVILLQYTAAIYVALGSALFLGERVTRGDWTMIVIVIGGMTLFFVDRLSFGGLLGNICALGDGLAFAGLILFLRKQKGGSPVETVILGNFLTALIGLPFMFRGMPDAQGWAGLLLLGIFQVGLSYILFTIAIKHVTAFEASLVPAIEPVLNPVWVFLFLGEVPGKWAILGGAVILSTITLRYAVRDSAVRYLRNFLRGPGGKSVRR
jgi:drug/metabolite transporter (DMT)-like permease